MPRTMQHSIVSSRAISTRPPETVTTAVISLEARPVEVMHPATRPAMAQATATVMQLLAPASSASKNFLKLRLSLLSWLFVAMVTRLQFVDFERKGTLRGFDLLLFSFFFPQTQKIYYFLLI